MQQNPRTIWLRNIGASLIANALWDIIGSPHLKQILIGFASSTIIIAVGLKRLIAKGWIDVLISAFLIALGLTLPLIFWDISRALPHKRQLVLVNNKLTNFSETERQCIAFIWSHGQVPMPALSAQSFDKSVIESTIRKGKEHLLIQEQRDSVSGITSVWINPIFQSALRFLLDKK
jgi:hypothetical protein